ncbi:MAG: hypothetical protein QXI19_06155, partial [Candidatus Caldarchaeum sp.]
VYCTFFGMTATVGSARIVPGIDTTEFPWVGKFYGVGGSITSAVAIDPFWIVTARHASFFGDTEGRFQPDGYPVFSSVQIVRHPTDDVALVRLSQPLPGWFSLYTGSSEVGSIASVVGYGVRGRQVGDDWDYDWGTEGTKRRGQNRVTLAQFLDLGSVRGWFLISDFDGRGVDSLGDGGPVTEESTLGPGDSGGGLMIRVGSEWQVAGVHSWVGSVGGGPQPPRYGSVFGSLQLRPYGSWIRGIIPERRFAESFSLVRGIPAGGGLQDLRASDDAYLFLRPHIVLFSGEDPIQVIFTTTATLSFSSLSLHLESAVNVPNVQQKVFLYNFQTNAWDLIDARTVSQEDSLLEVNITSNPSRYVNASTREMRIRAQFASTGLTLLFPWTVRLDWLMASMNP